MMMDMTAGCGLGGWLMAGVGVLVLAVLVLAVAALAKYVFWGGRRDGHGNKA